MCMTMCVRKRCVQMRSTKIKKRRLHEGERVKSRKKDRLVDEWMDGKRE